MVAFRLHMERGRLARFDCGLEARAPRGFSHKAPVPALGSAFIVSHRATGGVAPTQDTNVAPHQKRTRKDQQGSSFLGVFINRVVSSLSTLSVAL
jgi:hypothetical protein